MFEQLVERPVLEKVENLVHRINLLIVALRKIVAEVEGNITRLDRTPGQQQEIMHHFQELDKYLYNAHYVSASLLKFVPNREKIIEHMDQELKKGEQELKGHRRDMVEKFEAELKELMKHQNAHLDIINKYNDVLLTGRYASLLKVLDEASQKNVAFPEEAERLRKEFLHLMRKLVGAYDILWKTILSEEDLEEHEEKTFEKIYQLCEEGEENAQRDDQTLKLIHELEKEFE